MKERPNSANAPSICPISRSAVFAVSYIYSEITNYFIQRQSSGFVEGLNNKIKVIKRRC
ncbi:transposase [Methylobacter sp.]